MTMKKAVIFDSSAIITLALSNMLYILEPLKKFFDGNFLITSEVRREIVDVPVKQKRFELEALLISNLIKKGILQISSPAGIEKETENAVKTGNSAFSAGNEDMRIIHEGESSCFALATLLKEDYEVFLVIDERTARMLSEKPENLQKLFEKKLHTGIEADNSKFSYFEGFNIIRSSELLFIAYKKGIIELPTDSRTAVDALLYAAKFKGCAISFDEIEGAKQLIGKSF